MMKISNVSILKKKQSNDNVLKERTHIVMVNNNKLNPILCMK